MVITGVDDAHVAILTPHPIFISRLILLCLLPICPLYKADLGYTLQLVRHLNTFHTLKKNFVFRIFSKVRVEC